jgi:hypothetical protein
VSIVKLPLVNRWQWYSNAFCKAEIEWAEGKRWMTVTFSNQDSDTCKMVLSVDQLQDMINSFQEVLGPAPDKHVAFAEDESLEEPTFDRVNGRGE